MRSREQEHGTVGYAGPNFTDHGGAGGARAQGGLAGFVAAVGGYAEQQAAGGPEQDPIPA